VLATAHDMRREHRVISALHPTNVPVPRPILLCEDDEVLGAPFYVMEFVEGTPYRTADELTPIGPERTRGAVLELVDTLVELHAVDPAEVGLADFGRPEGFLDRQLRRWASSWTRPATASWQASRSCTRPSAATSPTPPPRPSYTATTASTTC
jgi:aminoglycoside phosphotransferase (APT) family kinase protein